MKNYNEYNCLKEKRLYDLRGPKRRIDYQQKGKKMYEEKNSRIKKKE